MATYTYGYQAPGLAPGVNADQMVPSKSAPVVSAQTINDGDVLILSSGNVESSGNNPSGSLVGLALHASGAVFAAGAAGSSNSKYSTPFGAFVSGFNLAETTNMHYVPFDGNTEFVFSLATGSDFAQSLRGTQVGIVKDNTTGFYYVDPSQSNKVATIVDVVFDPIIIQQQALGNTIAGGRVIVRFLAAALGA